MWTSIIACKSSLLAVNFHTCRVVVRWVFLRMRWSVPLSTWLQKCLLMSSLCMHAHRAPSVVGSSGQLGSHPLCKYLLQVISRANYKFHTSIGELQTLSWLRWNAKLSRPIKAKEGNEKFLKYLSNAETIFQTYIAVIENVDQDGVMQVLHLMVKLAAGHWCSLLPSGGTTSHGMRGMEEHVFWSVQPLQCCRQLARSIIVLCNTASCSSWSRHWLWKPCFASMQSRCLWRGTAIIHWWTSVEQVSPFVIVMETTMHLLTPTLNKYVMHHISNFLQLCLIGVLFLPLLHV